MNYIKRLALIVAILFIVLFLISLFLPSSLKIEKTIFINANQNIVFKQISEQEKIAVWSVWDNKKIEIKEIQASEIVIITSNFGYGEAKEELFVKQKDKGIELIWSIVLDFGFSPIAKAKGMFVEDFLVKKLDAELTNLRSYAENLPQINSSKVSKQFSSKKQWYLSIRDTINQMQMSNIHGKLYGEINGYMDENNIASDLAPIVIYHFWSDTLIDIEAGIQIADSVSVVDNRVKLNYIATGGYVTAIHYGIYERIPETYFSINEWMRKNEVQVIGPPWEVYITGPALEPNPEKWQTQINFPIQ